MIILEEEALEEMISIDKAPGSEEEMTLIDKELVSEGMILTDKELDFEVEMNKMMEDSETNQFLK